MTSPASSTRILVWDLPVRVFHGLLILCFALAWLSSESERWQLLHISAGTTLIGLVAFRLLWGLIGSRHARFASFVRGPTAAWGYLRELAAGRAPSTVGHNPAGALAILGLLALIALTAGTGLAMQQDLGGDFLEELHEAAAQATLLLVGVHVLGVIVGSLAHRENLVRSMVTGFKRGPADQGIARGHRGLAAVLLTLVLGYWAWQWQTAPVPDPGSAAVAGVRAEHHGHDDDDDDD